MPRMKNDQMPRTGGIDLWHSWHFLTCGIFRMRGAGRTIAVLTFLLAVTVSGFAQVRLGEVDPLTGGVAQFGIGCHNGITLALAEVNAAGGVLGRKVELTSEDDQSKPGQSATAVRKLITQDHVLAI